MGCEKERERQVVVKDGEWSARGVKSGQGRGLRGHDGSGGSGQEWDNIVY